MILLLANYCISQLYSHHILTTKTMAQALMNSSHISKTNNNNNSSSSNNNNINNNSFGVIGMLPEQMGQLSMHDHVLHKFPESPSSSFQFHASDLLSSSIGHIGNGSISSFLPSNARQQHHAHHTPPPPTSSLNFISDLNGMAVMQQQQQQHQQHHHHTLHSNLSTAATTANSTTISQPTIAAIVQNPSVHVYPIYFFNIEINGSPFGRILIEVRNDVAPKMAKNFGSLCTGELGFGYKGCSIFQCWENESIITGDFELNNGRGGRSVFEDSFFMPDDTKILAIRGSVGMRRSQKRHDNLGIILREMRGFTGIFAFVIEGLDLVDKISKAGDSAGKPQSNVIIVNCGKWQ